MKAKTKTSLRQLIATSWKDEQSCREYLENIRWDGYPECPHCGYQSDDQYKLTTSGVFKVLYKCKHCRKRFTVTVGTMFEGSHVPLTDWFYAISIFLSHKKGISSAQLSRDICVTQKTAWFMLGRIRHNLDDIIRVRFETETQIDETYVGGKNRKRNGKKHTQGRSTEIKTPVFGMLCNGFVLNIPVSNVGGKLLKSIIFELVKEGSTVVTDGLSSYRGLSKNYNHQVVNHSEGEYVRDGYHTNGIEGFWSQLKRGILGIYHLVSRKHLEKYCNEFAFRYNTRKMYDIQRFTYFMIYGNKQLKYRELIAN